MKAFMDKDFLLETPTAKTLYHDFAAKMPIIDYHCHISPKEIAQDKRFDNISQVWLGGDHYKWRVMRANGVPERLVTGDAPDEEKFAAWAATLPRCIGNPLFHWTYLELKKYFGVTAFLDESSAAEIYKTCNEVLARPDMSARGIIAQSDVRLICTTDDPADDLRWHKALQDDDSFTTRVLPAFRPDKAMNVDKPGFAAYIETLSAAADLAIGNFSALVQALYARVDFFNEMGCRASDHALDAPVYEEASPAQLDAIFGKAMQAQPISAAEGNAFRTAILLALSKKYAQYGWVMQIHFGCIRNNNTARFARLGPDTGYDAINNSSGAPKLAALLDAMERTESLPKTVLYSLNPNDNEIILSVMGCFQIEQAKNKLQLGSAWWFNDTKAGMEKQLGDYANFSVLANFIGMLTDSRSFLSYARHEYFRRILCNFIGNLVESGQYPDNLPVLGQMVQDISYNNTNNYFGFGL